MPAVRQPAIFLPPGGGPCFWMDWPPPFGPHAWDGLRDYLAGLVKSLPERPKAFLIITAHWEADKPTVSVNPKPGMLYDYHGFPEHTYKLSYPAPGDPELAAEVKRLVEAAGLPGATDGERGFDQGVAIIGSAMSFHDLRHFRDGDTTASAAFDAWLDETAKAPEGEREARLTAWDKAPSARECHPREEHLLPLMVVAGAAGDSKGTRDFNDKIGGKMISAFRFG